MNNIDDILERLKGQQPMIDDPDELTERIMDSLPDIEPLSNTLSCQRGEGSQLSKARTVRLSWLWTAAAAACIAIAVVLTWPKNVPQQLAAEKPSVAHEVNKATHEVMEITHRVNENTHEVIEKTHRVNENTHRVNETTRMVATVNHSVKDEEGHPLDTKGQENRPLDLAEEDGNMHYASCDLTKDTVPYQDPARVDEFIAKLADYNNVKQGELTCSTPLDSTVVSAVYVFPDKKEIDVFSRLLQVACWYSDETPGYFLSFSHQQFFFELKDQRRQLQYRWIAERVNGKILLYGTNAPLGTKESSSCYLEYRDELMHTKSINPKTKKI